MRSTITDLRSVHEILGIEEQKPVVCYGLPPVAISVLEGPVSDEMFYYQYLPIKMIFPNELVIPKQLECYRSLVLSSIADFGKADDHYIYITAKTMFVPEGGNLNRVGWHSDGFMSEDKNYVWSDSLPTEFIEGHFPDIPQDCDLSLAMFEKLAQENNVKECSPNVLYRFDESTIHRCAINKGKPFLRRFVKITFSKFKYNLKGNSHNYLIDYTWDMIDRNETRNHPHKRH